MKKQVVVIHGGDTFKTYEEYLSFLKDFEIDSLEYYKGTSWKGSLEEELGDGFEVIAPKMPSKNNAKFMEWKIWFEKLVPLLEQDIMLVGHSMGGIFLAKYLSENKFPKKIKAVFLVASPYDDRDFGYLGDFALPKSLDGLEKQANKLFIYHSTDDPIVPFVEFSKYKKALPKAHTEVFKDRGHFNQETYQGGFPEIVRDIKSL